MSEAVNFLSWDADGTLVTTTVDLVPGWEDTLEVQVTKNPVELGSPITDHITVMPRQLTVTAKVSQTPLYGGTLAPLALNFEKSRFRPAGLLLLTTGAGALLDAGLGAIGLGGGGAAGFSTYQDHEGPEDPGNDLHDKLIDAATNGYLVRLELWMGVRPKSLKPYEDYLIERIVKRVDSEEGEVSIFELSLTKPRIVKTEVSLLLLPLPVPIPEAVKALGALGLGKKPALVRDTPEAKAIFQKSLAASLADLAMG